MKTIVNLILRMALENRSWGYTRIRGARQSGHQVGRSTIANILHEHGIEPPLRETGTPDGQRFLKSTGNT